MAFRDLDKPDGTAQQARGDASTTAPAELYLDLLKRNLTRIGEVEHRSYEPAGGWRRFAYRRVRGAFDRRNLHLVQRVEPDFRLRAEGRDWPLDAETMIGLRRLDNLQSCIAQIVAEDVPGDLIETGVWRGGASIFMRAALEAYGDRERSVWLADSFEGLPKPDAQKYPVDAGDVGWDQPELAVSVDRVKENFERYGLLDERVHFLVGWFRDTLPSAPVVSLSLMRLDGDMYESTIVALESLYPKLSPGGFVVIDDFGLPGARHAVQDFRAENDIREPLLTIDWTGVYWRREGQI